MSPAAVAVDIGSSWHQRTVRIRNDGRRNKDWRNVRDKFLRPLAGALLPF